MKAFLGSIIGGVLLIVLTLVVGFAMGRDLHTLAGVVMLVGTLGFYYGGVFGSLFEEPTN